MIKGRNTEPAEPAQSGDRRPYWIKERYNPQLGTYYVACGQMSRTAAKRQENSLYGSNIMRRFDTRPEYLQAVYKLRIQGETVQ